MRTATATCRCGRSSGRVHGRYVRQLHDAAVGGLGVVIELCVRRFRCENPACTAVTFAEQVADFLHPGTALGPRRYAPVFLEHGPRRPHRTESHRPPGPGAGGR
ncbi:transposase family protein [Streptomyces incanus]|uniref:Transposase family protein n=1 Tax=Streptomyces incanus TaxID=887453 RepID=A0ABW0XSY4_9ACTN